MIAHALELAVARDLARRGGDLGMAYQRERLTRTRKADGTFVTEADQAVERLIRDGIADAFPEHDVLGEEDGLQAADGGPPRPGAPRWIVDPIDGTHNFMVGIPIWATLVALEVDGEVVVGCVHAPALGESYDAARGSGARCNGRPIAIEDRPLADGQLVYASDGHPERFGLDDLESDLRRRAWRTRGLGDFFGHMLVARGAAQAMVEYHTHLKPYDVAALVPIAEEAGARITDLRGRPWQPGRAIVTAAPIAHGEIVAAATRLVAGG